MRKRTFREGFAPLSHRGPLTVSGAPDRVRTVNFQQMLQAEFGQRRQRNPRYSLRAFARHLGTDHSTLSQILRRRRRLSPRLVRRFGERLRLDPGVIRDVCGQQQAEAILRLIHLPAFRTDSRWIATQTGLSLDAVNAAIHRLLQQGDLVMESVNRWTATRTPHA